MLALASVWIALVTFLLAVTMLLFRPAFTDVTVPLVLWLGVPIAWCFAGLVLWSHRKESALEPSLVAQRLQAKVAFVLGFFAASIVYGLIIGSKKFERIDEAHTTQYNPPHGDAFFPGSVPPCTSPLMDDKKHWPMA